jgi:negative regulator of flagellin synthesis FlgM
MKIQNSMMVHKLVKSYQKNMHKTEETKAALPSDKIEISKEARAYQVAMQGIKEIPDVRQEKVEALKAQIKEGTYRPPAEDIAAKILGELSSDE